MGLLFGRSWRLRVDTLQFSGTGKPGDITMSFDVEKTIKAEPNKATIKIWNLIQDHQRQLQALSVQKGRGRIRVELEAGYQSGMMLLFRGDLRRAGTSRSGPDLITEVSGEDGGRSVIWSRVNRSFPPGTTVEVVAKACAEAMGLGLGNLPEIVRGKRMGSAGSTFFDGCVLSGNAADELTHILRSLGLSYSIQDGAVQVIERGKALQASAVVLGSGTGLIDRPVVNADGTVSASSLLIPDLYPGRKVQFDTVDLAGIYTLQKTNYVGGTEDNEWYCNMEAKAA